MVRACAIYIDPNDIVGGAGVNLDERFDGVLQRIVVSFQDVRDIQFISIGRAKSPSVTSAWRLTIGKPESAKT